MQFGQVTGSPVAPSVCSLPGADEAGVVTAMTAGDNVELSANPPAVRPVGTARRVAASDPTALRDLVAMRAALDEAIDDAAVELHAAGYSWTDIGRELGVTRQAARQRWGKGK